MGDESLDESGERTDDDAGVVVVEVLLVELVVSVSAPVAAAPVTGIFVAAGVLEPDEFFLGCG